MCNSVFQYNSSNNILNNIVNWILLKIIQIIAAFKKYFVTLYQFLYIYYKKLSKENKGEKESKKKEERKKKEKQKRKGPEIFCTHD